MSDAATLPGAAPAARISLAAPLGVRNFRSLWLGQSISLVGDQFKFVALSWLVLSLTGRPGALGSVLMLLAIPRAMLMLAGGVASDRFRPRTVMLFSDASRALVVGAIGVLTLTEHIAMSHLYVLALLIGIVQAFFFPAAAAITPELVERTLLPTANAVNQMTNQIVLIGAPVLAGFTIAAVGSAGGFFVDAVSFLISAAFLLLIKPGPRPDRPVAQNAWRDLVEGFTVVRRDPVLLAMIAMASVFSFGYAGATYVGLPVLVKGPLGGGPRELGVLFAASGLGALIGGLIGGTMRVRRRGLVGVTLIGAVGALLAAVSLAQTVWQGAVLLFGSGALLAWIGITYITMIQHRAERAYMGRVMGMLMFGIYGLYPFSYGLAGWISQAGGVRLLFILGGGLILASAMLGVSVRELRALG